MLLSLSKDRLGDYIRMGKPTFPQAEWHTAEQRLGLMLDKWNKGIICYVDGDMILGYVTLWPITAQAYKAFLSGELKDQDFNVTHIEWPQGEKGSYWISTAVAVFGKKRKERHQVLSSLILELSKRLDGQRPCWLIAHAETPQGESLLRRRGFSEINPADHLYQMHLA